MKLGVHISNQNSLCKNILIAALRVWCEMWAKLGCKAKIPKITCWMCEYSIILIVQKIENLHIKYRESLNGVRFLKKMCRFSPKQIISHNVKEYFRAILFQQLISGPKSFEDKYNDSRVIALGSVCLPLTSLETCTQKEASCGF